MRPSGSCAKEAFDKFCQAVGRNLDPSKYEIVITTDKHSTADYQVAIAAANRGVNINVLWPTDRDRTPTFSFKPRSFDYISSGWTSGSVQAILRADLVLIIGGQDKTGNVPPICHALSVPYIPVPQFGGKAHELFDQYRAYLNSVDQDAGRLLKELGSIQEFANPEQEKEAINKIFELADILCKRGLFDGITFPRSIGLFLITLMLGGVTILSTYIASARLLAWPLVLIWLCAVILGSIAGYFVDHTVTAQGWRKLASFITLNSTRALVLSLALFVGLLILQYPASGTVPVFLIAPSSGDHANYLRLSLLVFGLAFGAAWLQERVTEKVRQSIEKILT
jgi:hypothetical protein